jgi:hypothetical protein
VVRHHLFNLPYRQAALFQERTMINLKTITALCVFGLMSGFAQADDMKHDKDMMNDDMMKDEMKKDDMAKDMGHGMKDDGMMKDEGMSDKSMGMEDDTMMHDEKMKKDKMKHDDMEMSE